MWMKQKRINPKILIMKIKIIQAPVPVPRPEKLLIFK
jgi:hypothetical protein